MDKKVWEIVEERSGGCCELCGNYWGVEKHHIVFGKGKREEHENEYSVINLCYEHHRGTWGVHGMHGHKLDIKLKQRLQKEYEEQGYDEDEIRKLMGGKLY